MCVCALLLLLRSVFFFLHGCLKWSAEGIIHRKVEMLIYSVCLVFGAKASIPSLLLVSLLPSVA